MLQTQTVGAELLELLKEISHSEFFSEGNDKLLRRKVSTSNRFHDDEITHIL